MKKIIVAIVLVSGIIYAAGVKPVNNELYAKECGSCHFAFQPGLLPARSWKKIMGNLSNHFQADASLDKMDTQTLLSYMINNSSDNSMKYKRSYRITRSLSNSDTPIRISQTSYFIRKHDEIRRSVFRRKSIRSASNCIACHQGANKGNYNEDYVRIPR